MKYFIDTEFLEGTQRESFPISLVRKNSKPTIDLISIGIVAEDGREYYAISKDFNLKEAWDRYDIVPAKIVCNIKQRRGGVRYLAETKKIYWIRDNVLKPIHYELASKKISTPSYDVWLEIITKRENGVYGDRHYKTLKRLINKYGKTNKQIADEVKEFCTIGTAMSKLDGTGNFIAFRTKTTKTRDFIEDNNCKHIFEAYPIEFYGYYCDYDWVVFCWLFGRMIDLPKDFPMYCIDLKQELDRKYPNGKYKELRPFNKELDLIAKINPETHWIEEPILMHPNYPKQTNEHSAIHDAKWNKQLYQFLNNL